MFIRCLLRSEGGIRSGLTRHVEPIVRKTKPFTDLQGQYLAFIYAYTKLNACAPSEADMQRHFRVTAPSVHRMVLALEKGRFIERQPRQARSIKLLVHPEKLPVLR